MKGQQRMLHVLGIITHDLEWNALLLHQGARPVRHHRTVRILPRIPAANKQDVPRRDARRSNRSYQTRTNRYAAIVYLASVNARRASTNWFSECLDICGMVQIRVSLATKDLVEIAEPGRFRRQVASLVPHGECEVRDDCRQIAPLCAWRYPRREQRRMRHWRERKKPVIPGRLDITAVLRRVEEMGAQACTRAKGCIVRSRSANETYATGRGEPQRACDSTDAECWPTPRKR